ncbi:MAG: hypothetical protein RKE49_12635 [Oceanicaulis sp.]
MKKHLIALTAGLAATFCVAQASAQEPERGAASDPALSPAAGMLLARLETATAAATEATPAAEIRARLIQALVDAEQDREAERAALERLIAQAEIGAVRAAALAVLAQMPATEEGYDSLNDFELGGLEGGLAAVPGAPAPASGGGSDY